MSRDALGDRMKAYERASGRQLTRKMPVIIRVDGKSFHTALANYQKPYDEGVGFGMRSAARYLVDNIQGAKLAYTQSDEISVLVTDYDAPETDSWFGYNTQKVVSVSAAMASAKFTKVMGDLFVFDGRAFNVPEVDVANYFYWRSKDAYRNFYSAVGRHIFGHKYMQFKPTKELKNAVDPQLMALGINFIYRDGWVATTKGPMESLSSKQVKEKVKTVLGQVRKTVS